MTAHEKPGGEQPSARAPDLGDADLDDLLVAFYATVECDPLLASYFIDLDMREHMPRIVAFWSTMLFHTGQYTGNAFRPHAMMPGLTGAHFTRWLEVMEDTIDARFAGPAADRMKTFAHRVAFSMQLRLGISPFAARAIDNGGAAE
jgi:hemoglobin